MNANPIKWGSPFLCYFFYSWRKQSIRCICELSAAGESEWMGKNRANRNGIHAWPSQRSSWFRMYECVYHTHEWELESDSMKFTSEGGWIYMILWCNARNQNKYTTLKKIDKHKMRERNDIVNPQTCQWFGWSVSWAHCTVIKRRCLLHLIWI